MRGRKLDVLKVVAVITDAAGVMLSTLGSATALQGTVCGDYSLPKGAQVHQLGTALDANGSKIIWIEYQAPGAGGKLTIPFDTIAVTCADPLIRGIVAHVQESSREMIQASCKFVGDALARLRRHPVRPCTPRRHPSPRRIRCRRLRPGVPAAHETADVPLLPSGPGGVGQISLRRTQPSLLRTPAGS